MQNEQLLQHILQSSWYEILYCTLPFYVILTLMYIYFSSAYLHKVWKWHDDCVLFCTQSIGYVPAIFFIESIMANIADSLGLDVEQVKRANLYQQGDISPTVSKIKYITDYLCLFQQATTSTQLAVSLLWTPIAHYFCVHDNFFNRWTHKKEACHWSIVTYGNIGMVS